MYYIALWYVNTLVLFLDFALPWTGFVIYNISKLRQKVHKNSYNLSTDCAINHLSEGEQIKRYVKLSRCIAVLTSGCLEDDWNLKWNVEISTLYESRNFWTFEFMVTILNHHSAKYYLNTFITFVVTFR